jgi:hypothetical protein
MPSRRLPARPNLDQLKHQAKDLLKAYRAGDGQAADDFAAFHPERVSAARAKLADAQLALARRRTWLPVSRHADHGVSPRPIRSA